MYGYNSYEDPNMKFCFIFEYKTYNDQVFKIKQTDTRFRKSIRKNRYI